LVGGVEQGWMGLGELEGPAEVMEQEIAEGWVRLEEVVELTGRGEGKGVEERRNQVEAKIGMEKGREKWEWEERGVRSEPKVGFR